MRDASGRARARVVRAAAAATAIIGVAAALAGTARGADYIGPSEGTWSNAANWNPAAVPDGPAANAIISFAPATDGFLVFHDYVYVPATGIGDILINSSNPNRLEIFSHADMHAVAATIGDTGNGTYTQAFAANATFDALFLGNAIDARGTYQHLSTGALSVAASEYIGYAGAGTFAQSSGTHTAGSAVTPADVYLGYQSSATGVYHLGGGQFTVNGTESIAQGGAGTFTQTGGTHQVNGFEYVGYAGVGRYVHSAGDHFVGGGPFNFVLGFQAGASGTYELGGSAVLAVGGAEYIGYGGTGAVAQTDGFHSVNGAQYLGLLPGSSGSYALGGGTLAVSGGAYIGFGGGGASGSFTQSSGTYTVGTPTTGAELAVGGDVGASGAYTLAGGSLMVRGATRVGLLGTGTFTQSGGTHDVLFTSASSGRLQLASADTASGTYQLGAGATLNVSSGTDVGVSGAGTFSQTGGTHTVGGSGGGSLRIAVTGGSSGVYTMANDAVLRVDGAAHVGLGGTGTFVQSGGTHTIGSPALNGELRIGVLAASAGRYDLTGATASLTVNGSAFVGDGGGGDFAQSGGTHSVNGDLRLANSPGSTGNYVLGGASTTLTMTGSEQIGYGGAGTFAQNGGAHVVGASAGVHQLVLGMAAGSTGRYTLDAGSLQVFGSVIVGNGGTGSFVQTGGNSTVGVPGADYALRFGASAGGSGSYELAGGELTAQGRVDVGFFGDGTFAQTGGAHSIGAGGLWVGSSFGGDGTYTLAAAAGGSVVLAVSDEHIGGGTGAGAGSFVHTGGLHLVGSILEINAAGTYDLSGTGELAVAGLELLGTAAGGIASFTQSGGTHGVGTPSATGMLVLGNAAGSSARYTLASGELAVHATEVVGGSGAGTFVQSGGTHTVGSSTAIADFRIAQQPGSIGSYALTGVAATLVVNGTAFVGGSGSGPGGIGTLDIAAGNAHIDSLIVFDTGPASPAGTRVNLAGGTLSLGALNLSGNLARFNWTGGTLHFTNGVLIEATGPLGGTIDLAAGKTLSTGGGTLTNNGTILMSGGTIGGAGAIDNTGAITGFGTITGAGGFTNHGSVIQSAGGNIVFSNTGATNTNFGNIDLAAGRQFTLGGAGGSGGALLNRGTINLNNAMVNGAAALTNAAGATISGRGTITAALANPSGVIAVSGGTLNVTQPLNSGGAIRLDGAGAHLGGGAITNTGRILGNGSVSSAIVNANGGRIEPGGAGATLTLGGVVANHGGATLSSGVAGSTLLIIGGLAGHTNNGSITINGGTFDYAAASPMTNAGTISGRGTVQTSAGLINDSQIQLSGGFSDVHGGVSGNSGSRIVVSGGATTTFYDIVTLNSGSEFRVSNGATAVFFGDVTGFGVGTFTGGGTKIFEGGSSSVSSIAAGGVTVVQAAADVTAGHVREAALSVDGVMKTSAGGGTSRVGALDVGDDGSLDLSDNKLIVAGGADDVGTFDGTRYTGLTGHIASAYNFSAWDGPGIKTSQFAAGPNSGVTTIAIATADEVFYAGGTFGGLPVSSGDVLSMYTYAGDLNLDGLIDGADYGLIDNYVQFPGTSGYSNGDINYDGAIDGADYGILDNAIQLQGDPFPAGTFGASVPPVGVTAVPEPAACGIAVSIAVLTIARRRRRDWSR